MRIQVVAWPNWWWDCFSHVNKKPIDYQGFIFEHEESFSNFAEQMTKNFENVASNVTMKHFRTLASFDKMGFLSIVLHVFFSLHFHGFIKTEDDSIDFCIYFGCFCNGIVQLAKVWQQILADKGAQADSPPSVERNCFWLLERADLKVFLVGKDNETVDPATWNAKTGCSLLPMFQFNSKGPAAIKQDLVHISERKSK